MPDTPELLPDEHECPTHLGARVPILPALAPFDWTMRQLYGAAIAFYVASLQIPDARSFQDWLAIAGYVLLGAAWIIVEYAARPTPEFWLSAWLEYLGVLVLSLPLWWRRVLPAYGPRTLLRAWWRRWRYSERMPSADGADWPLATLPHWLGERLLAGEEVLPDGVVRWPGRPGRPPTFGAAIGLAPRPNPDLLPMLDRQRIIQSRLNIFKRIHCAWSLRLEVRPFDAMQLEVAAGPAWPWVKRHVLPEMVARVPYLVLQGADGVALAADREALVRRFHKDASMPAWAVQADEARQHAQLLWAENRLRGMADRVRVGIRRIMAGRRGYRSFVIREMPRIIHLAWLRPLTSEALRCSIAIHVVTRPAGATRRGLLRRIRRWRAVDTDEDYALAEYDARRVVAALRRNLDTAASVAMYVSAPIEEADEVAEALDAAQCEFSPANAMQQRALRATHTWGNDPLRRPMQLDLRSVACTDLLATSGYWPAGATLIGRSLGEVEPVGLNLVDKSRNLNSSTFVAMIQGAGKTTFAMMLGWRMANPHPHHPLAAQGINIVTVDFKRSGDYEPLFNHLAARGQRASYNAWDSGALPSIEGHMGFNLSNVPGPQRGERLLELAQRVQEWADRHALDRTLLLILDEILALANLPEGAEFIQETGTQGRSLGFAPVYCTQHIAPVLKHERTQMAFTNAGHLFMGRQNPAGINAMAPLLSLDSEAQLLLAGAPDGAGLLRIERRDGPVLIGVQVEPTDWELAEFGTNPGERLARFQRDHQRGRTNGHTRLRGTRLPLVVGSTVEEVNGHVPD